MLEIAFATIFPAAMAFAGTMDLFTMTIPNKISIVLVVAFFIVAPFAGLGIEAIAFHVLTAMIVLGIGIFMFWMQWIGGGDAKIFAAASLWFGFDFLGEFALLTAIVGGVLTLAMLAFRAIPMPEPVLRLTWVERLYGSSAGVPYGIAIAIAALMLYPNLPWVESFLAA